MRGAFAAKDTGPTHVSQIILAPSFRPVVLLELGQRKALMELDCIASHDLSEF
jgi:hypothetical protein